MVLEEVEIFGPAGVPADHLKRHPFGRIPVLVHGTFSVYETQAICRYVDEAFPGAPLQPATPAARARMAQLIGLLDSYAYRPMVWGIFVQRVRLPLRGGVADEELVAASVAEARRALAAIASLAGESPFLAGPSLTLADLHAYPICATWPWHRKVRQRLPSIRSSCAGCARSAIGPVFNAPPPSTSLQARLLALEPEGC